LEAIGGAGTAGARAGLGHIAHPRRGAANRAGSLELTRGGATVTVTEVAVVTLFARVKDTVATVCWDRAKATDRHRHDRIARYPWDKMRVPAAIEGPIQPNYAVRNLLGRP